jgi:hypothetical protein
VQATSEKLITDFNQFAPLKDIFLEDSFSFAKPLLQLIQSGSKEHSLSIELCIKTIERAILDHVRIDVKGLIPLLSRERIEKTATCRITLSYRGDDGTYEDTACVHLSDLQKRIYLLLADLLITWPVDLPEDISGQLPSVWINGHGTLIEVCYPATTTWPGLSVSNRHGQLREEEVLMRGYRLSKEVVKICEDRRGGKWVSRALFDLWVDLRDCHWQDYSTRNARSMIRDW